MAIKSDKYNFFVKVKGADDSTYQGVGCHLDYSNILHKGTRDLVGNTCMSITEDDSDNGKRLKSKTFDNGTVKYVYNPQSNDGQKLLNDAFDDGTTKLTIKFELDDKGNGLSSTFIERDVLVTSIEPVPEDEEFVETASFEFLNAPRKTDRVEA